MDEIKVDRVKFIEDEKFIDNSNAEVADELEERLRTKLESERLRISGGR